MRTAKDLTVYLDVRARMQRLRDARFFSGWVQATGSETITVTVPPLSEVAVGDEVMVEIFGPGQIAMGKAEVEACEGGLCRLFLTSELKERTNPESVRYALRGLSCTLKFEGCDISGDVKDGSESGVAVVIGQTLPRKALVDVEIMTSMGEVVCRGEVRYARPDISSFGKVRVGLVLTEMSRISRTRWHQALGLDE